jgi:hypothetical protein
MTEAQLISSINERFAFINSLKVIYDLVQRKQTTKSAFRMWCENRRLDGKASDKLWLESPGRKTYESFAYHE